MDRPVTMLSGLTAFLAVCILVFFPDFYPFTSPYEAWRTASSVKVQQIPEAGGASGRWDWNILYHLGGNGPWIPKVDGVVEGGIDVPQGCNIEQIHMVGLAIDFEVSVLSDFLSSFSYRFQGMLNGIRL